MLYVWFVFNMINFQNPFTIGLPFTPKTYALTNVIHEINEFVTKEYATCPKMLSFFYYKK